MREFVEKVFAYLDIKIIWKGKGMEEVGIDANTQNTLIEMDKLYLRPTEVDFLQGDYSKAKNILGWEPKISLDELVQEMVDEDLKSIRNF